MNNNSYPRPVTYAYNPIYPAINNINRQVSSNRKGLCGLSFIVGVLAMKAWVDHKDIKDLKRQVSILQKKTEESGSK
jgi:hypothetical protein